ncbi:unnamed protein product [Lymnaea stagnalis]|uniref:PIH1D1/2/3 CS-like domain-containing protein n=1 Tax=Lymnaea stagnalis TaxID=6523 RepID=A0AAV2IEW8_LYMST
MDNINSESMSKQAQQIWAMLDDMSENDPSAYKKFIERQLQEGKEHISPPEPHMCVQATLVTKPSKPLFINFCSWKRIPEPKSPQDPVPVTGTRLTHEKGGFSLTSVAFNPRVLEEYGRNAKNSVDGDTLIQLALDYIEAEQKVKVTRTYTVLPVETPHKGDLNLIQLSFTKLNKQQPQPQNDVEELEKMFGPLSTREKDSLLYKLTNMAGNDATDKDEHPDIVLSGIPSTPTTRVKLIEELKDIKLTTPKYSLEPLDAPNGRQLVLRVDLPGVKSVSECELDISEDDVKLVVPGQYELKIKLPSCIEDEESCAKFNRKTSVLTLTMPVKT